MFRNGNSQALRQALSSFDADFGASLEQEQADKLPVLHSQGPGICEHYAVQTTALKRRAAPIGATVVSHIVSEFSRVEGLQLVDWAV